MRHPPTEAEIVRARVFEQAMEIQALVHEHGKLGAKIQAASRSFCELFEKTRLMAPEATGARCSARGID